MPFCFYTGTSSVRLQLLRDQELAGNNHTTYQRFAGALEHITDILAQPGLCWLPTDEAKMINMFYTLRGGKKYSVYCKMSFYSMLQKSASVLCFHAFMNFSFSARYLDRGHNVKANLCRGLLTHKIKGNSNLDCFVSNTPAHHDSGPWEEKYDGMIHCLL